MNIFHTLWFEDGKGFIIDKLFESLFEVDIFIDTNFCFTGCIDATE